MTPTEREQALQDFRAAIQIGLDQAKRGELVDGEQVMKQMLAKIKKEPKPRGKSQ